MTLPFRSLLKFQNTTHTLPCGRIAFLRLMRTARLTIGLTCLAAVSACATATRGPNVDFHIVTEPAGAMVTTDLRIQKQERQSTEGGELSATSSFGNYFSCEATPCSFKVSRKSEFSVNIEREGYHPVTVNVSSGFGSNRNTKVSGGFLTTPEAANGVMIATGVTFGVAAVATASTTATSVGTAITTGANASLLGGGAVLFTGVGLISLGVDLASGSMLSLTPNPLILVLVPADEPYPEETDGLINDPETLREILEQHDREINKSADGQVS